MLRQKKSIINSIRRHKLKIKLIINKKRKYIACTQHENDTILPNSVNSGNSDKLLFWPKFSELPKLFNQFNRTIF